MRWLQCWRIMRKNCSFSIRQKTLSVISWAQSTTTKKDTCISTTSRVAALWRQRPERIEVLKLELFGNATMENSIQEQVLPISSLPTATFWTTDQRMCFCPTIFHLRRKLRWPEQRPSLSYLLSKS